MAKLVVLSEGFTGLTYELKVEKTTVGRVEDNAFQISEQSVSSHHCELLQRSNDILVKDLNSTNGTFINGERLNLEGFRSEPYELESDDTVVSTNIFFH